MGELIRQLFNNFSDLNASDDFAHTALQLGFPKPLAKTANCSWKHLLQRCCQFSQMQESVRIASTGLTLRRKGDLLYVAPAGPGRTQSYLDGFATGAAMWYHTRDEAINRDNIPMRVMNDITHVAVAVPVAEGQLSVTRIYDVRQVRLCKRSDISELQAGTAIHASTEDYWLFELGNSVALDTPVQLPEEKHFRFGMCSIADLKSAKNWNDISGRYSYLYTEQTYPHTNRD